MPLLINSAPDCVVQGREGATPPDDSADFILQDRYADCAGFGTFMPGSTYGEDGSSAETLYYILTWLGIVVTVLVLIAWVVYENRQLVGHVTRLGRRPAGPDEPPPPQPGI
jgi:hypothetical protein